MGKAWEHYHMNDVWWTWGGCGWVGGGGWGACLQLNDRASFVQMKLSTVDLDDECLGSWLLLERSMMKSSMLFERSQAFPGSILQVIKNWSWGRPGNEARSLPLLTSTGCHSWCSQALPIFRRSSAFVYYTEHKPKNKECGRPGKGGYCTLAIVLLCLRVRVWYFK